MTKVGAFTGILFLLLLTSCKQEAEVECFQMVHQNPTPEFLRTYSKSNPPAERLIFFLKISGVKQVDDFKATLACQGSSQEINLVGFPNNHEGYWNEGDFYTIQATRFDTETVHDLATNCSTFLIRYTYNKVSRTMVLQKKFDLLTMKLTMDDVNKIMRNKK